jgi:hypothetical protein
LLDYALQGAVHRTKSGYTTMHDGEGICMAGKHTRAIVVAVVWNSSAMENTNAAVHYMLSRVLVQQAAVWKSTAELSWP